MSKINLTQFNESTEQRGKTYVCKLIGASPLCFGKFHKTPKLDKESDEDYEGRTWREKLHYDENGHIFIPSFALKNMISATAKYLSISIPGKGKATFTKHFESGIMCPEEAYVLNGEDRIHKDSVQADYRMVPSNGVRGGTTRVMKAFPVIPNWSIKAKYMIIDNVITNDIFAKHMIEAGFFIGLMSFRPRNNGVNGRFKVDSISVM
jgi:hypothetical protein